ncbi:MAG: hypothetical protein JOZ17_16650 [Acetobacteraceae bacterium]|nr:hypothetical protein [Acetobacteraceae bacterium]
MQLDVAVVFYDTTTAYFEIDAADADEQEWGGRHRQLEPGETLLLKFWITSSRPNPVSMSNPPALTQVYCQILLGNPLN